MKKIYAFLLTVITIMAVSCSKEGFNNLIDPEENDSETIKINITFPGGTKAAKTAWVAGDKLNIWFTTNHSDLNHAAPDLVITYNGTDWIAGALREGAAIDASGDEMLILYEGYNDISSYTYHSSYFSMYAYNSDQFHSCFSNSLVFAASEIPYTFASNTLTATIASWTYETMFKVVVKDDDNCLTKAADRYRLKVENTANGKLATEKGAFRILYSNNHIKVLDGGAYEKGWTGGVQEADGIAFYYMSFAADDQDVLFTLKDMETSLTETYYVTNKTLDATQQDRCLSVALKHSNFNKDIYFSVSATKKVVLSPGNLQYQASTNTWRFAENQWDYIGGGNDNIAEDYDGWIDLFGWGTSGISCGAICYQPWSTDMDNSKYYVHGNSTASLSFASGNADWGKNTISNGGSKGNHGWRTPYIDEWVWLIGPEGDPNTVAEPGVNCRTSSTVGGVENARYAHAKLFGTKAGLIIFPDVYNHPAGVANPVEINVAKPSSTSINIYYAADWAKMEAAGAIFLPSGGHRVGTTTSNYGGGAIYWSADYYGADRAYYLQFGTQSVYNYNSDYNKGQRYFGCAVRLIRDL